MAFGLPSRAERRYAQPERLGDVMALIQVLALDKYAHRSEDGVSKELQGPPRSASTWTEIARDHPEFFRVNPDASLGISLISRHVTLDNKGAETLSPEYTGSLLRSAIDIHDRQVRRAERWTYLVPIWVALIVGLFTLLGTLLEIGS